MTGRRYYITTLADWHRHAHRFAHSHWLALDASASEAAAADSDAVGARHAVPERADTTAAPSTRELAAEPVIPSAASAIPSSGSGQPVRADAQSRNLSSSARILVLVDADEGVHLTLEDDAAFEALPHAFAPKAISDAVHQALASHGVAPGATTFDAAEAVARIHPLLRPRVF